MFRHADGYRGKRVVVVGVGNSACDAAVDLSDVCSQVKTYQHCHHYHHQFTQNEIKSSLMAERKLNKNFCLEA